MKIISCEHGGNKIPKQYRSLFNKKKTVLNSHRGWDKGALILARYVATDLSVPLVYSDISRLLIDLNRSLHHPKLFSEFSNSCDKKTKQEIINNFYMDYRFEVENYIKEVHKTGHTVLHLSIHSFTPVLNRIKRNTDIGLLYDPSRSKEKLFCSNLQDELKDTIPGLIVRRNYPYRGNADGFTTELRKIFDDNYLGIEIEINQKHITAKNPTWSSIRLNLGKTIRQNCRTMQI